MRSLKQLVTRDDDSPLTIVLVAVCVNVLLFTLFFLAASPCYATNDDARMEAIASGEMTGEPSEHLVFSNILIGKLLKRLYETRSDVDWYPASLFLAHFTAMTTLLAVLLKRRFALTSVGLFVLLFATVELRLLLQVQFTTAAFVLSASGILLVLSVDGLSKPMLVVSCIGIAEIVWGAMIREQSFYLAAVVTGPLWIYESLRRRTAWLIAQLALASLLAWGVDFYETRIYSRQSEWAAFFEHNRLRGQIHGTPLVAYDPQSKPFFDRLGWSSNDVEMYMGWFFTDRDFFSTDAERRIIEEFSGRTRSRWFQYYRHRLAAADVYLFATAGIFMFALILCGSARVEFAIVCLSSLVLNGVLLGYLALYLRVPDRVILSLVICTNMIAIYLCCSERVKFPGDGSSRRTRLSDSAADPASGSKQRRARNGLLLFALSISLLWSMYRATERNISINLGNRINHRAFVYFVSRLRADYAGDGQIPLFVRGGGQLREAWAPMFSNDGKLSRFSVVPLGWTVGSPHSVALLEEHGIDNLYKAIYQRPDVYLLSTEGDCRRLATFVREHYGDKIACRVDAHYVYEHETTAGARELIVRKPHLVNDSAPERIATSREKLTPRTAD